MRCPECGSTRIGRDIVMGSNSGDKKCLDCGYAHLPGKFEEPPASTQKDTPPEPRL